MAVVELDRVAAQPLGTQHGEAGPLQRFGGRQVVLVRPGEDDLDRVDQLPPDAEPGPPPGSGRKGSPRMLASYSEITRSKAASASGICSALA